MTKSNQAFPDPTWVHIGSTTISEHYAMREDVIVIVPRPDCRDTEETARESLAFQRRYWREKGHRGAVIIFMDPVLEQDAGARAVYTNETGDTGTTGYALIGETLFAQATSAVFMGLAKPAVVTRVFASLPDALPFVDEMNSTYGGKL